MAKAYPLGLLASCLVIAACGSDPRNNSEVDFNAIEESMAADQNYAEEVANYIASADALADEKADERAYSYRWGQPWYLDRQPPQDLQAALLRDRTFLGSDHASYRHQGGAAICRTFRRVGLPCDYNTRTTVSIFLTVNGKGLFPASGGTNPYCSPAGQYSMSERPDDCFIGRGPQNAMLEAAVRRNRSLFRNGNLTAEDVRTRWR